MTYLEVLTDICSQVADPELDTYKERAKDHFLRAIAMLINEGKYTERDIAGFVKTKATMSFAGGAEDINALKVFKILGFYMPPGVDEDIIITYQETPLLNKISALETLQPSIYDLFIYPEGNNLKAYVSAAPQFVLGTDNCTMKYIEDIDDNNWTDATDLQAAASFQLTYTFTRTCIDIASKTLLDEVNL